MTVTGPPEPSDTFGEAPAAAPGSRGPRADATSLLVLQGITKRFGPTRAVDDVTVDFAGGVVHALVGENGAGKTTLLNIIAGVVRPDPPSTMLVDGVQVDWARHSPRVAQALGISIVPQEFALIESMNVAENVLLGRELRRGPVLRRRDMGVKVERLLRRLGANFSADTPVERLGVAQAQLVEIAKALAIDSRIVAMDEPSAVLAGDELERLFRIVRQLADDGVGVIYVSHRLDEVFAHCDRFSVMKDGRLVESGIVKDVDRDRLVRLMVGREVSEAFPDRRAGAGPTVLRIEELSVEGKLHVIDLEVRGGEIVGVAGLMGSGRTTLAKAIFGAIPVSEGATVEVGESRGPFRDPRAALAAGVAYLPEDRRREGLATRKSVKMNTTLLGLDRVSGGIPRLIRPRAEREMVGDAISRFSIRASPEGRDLVMRLSGGNQQKVVLAKWLEAGPKVLILDEPTRGVDVGSKQEIYRILRDLANEGLGIVVISSELIEVLGLADRIVVMCAGRIAGELPGGTASEEDLMRLATTAGETAHEEELR